MSEFAAHGFQSDAQKAALNFSVRQDLRADKLRFVRRQGETDSAVVARQRGDLRIHADRFAVHINQWAAAVPAIDGRVGLQKALKVREQLRVAFLLGDDSSRDRLFQAKRRTNRQHPIANLN